MQRTEGCGTDFRLSGPTFRDDERRLPAVKLPLNRLCHRKLGIVKRIARVLRNKIIDRQDFI